MGAGEEESTPLLLVHKDFDVIVNHQEENDFHLKKNSSRSKTNILRRIATFMTLILIVSLVIYDHRKNPPVGISCDSDKYATCNPFQCAFPERSFALIVTLLLELPTLFFISGGSDQLCFLIGRKKYTTLISLLPLTSAISGNVRLQASTLTTRAISHLHVRKDNYFSWLHKEISAAIYLGFVIGLVMAIIAFAMGGYNYAFSFSIFFAQFIGIATAGITGTFTQLLFTFIFHRDSGKWGGQLEMAVQDIVGSFAMIVVTYQIMQFFGPFDIEPTDICGSGG
jgi:hypothetical protein